MIRAIILDLDDTLWDTTGQHIRKGQIAALKAMARHGLPIKQAEAPQVRDFLVKRYGRHINITQKAVEHFGLYKKDKKKAEKLRLLGHHAYHTAKLGRIKPFKDTIPTLKRLKDDKKILVMLSYGDPGQQNRKIDKLGIRKYFNKIVFDDTIGKSNKIVYIKKIILWLKKKGIRKDETLLVGDKISSEIQAGKRLGLTTVRMRQKRGRYYALKPENRFQKADYEIKRISGLMNVVAKN